MKTEYDKRGDIYYWSLLETVDENEIIRNFVKTEFSEYIQSKKKKKVMFVDCLTFLFTNLFMKLSSLDDDELEHLLVFHNDIEFLNENGYGVRFNRKNKTFHFFLGNKKVVLKTLRKTIDELEELGLVLDIKKGNFCYNNGGVTSSYELGITYFNWERVYELYNSCNIENIIEREEYTYEPGIIIKKPIFIKKKRTTKKIYEVTEEYNYLIEENEELKNSKVYLQKLYDMYSSVKVSLLEYDDAPIDIQNEVDRRINDKLKNSDNKVIYQHDIDNDITKWNRYLSCQKSPRRIYHYDNDTLSWGRMYGNGIDSLPNVYKPLLLINDSLTASVDIKSTLLQLFILKFYKEIDNKQDFYSYTGLNGILDRTHIKLLSQCLNYNETLGKVNISYNNACVREGEFNKILKKDKFNEVIEIMKEERPYLFGLFLNADMNKQMIHEESKMVMKVSSSLMNKGIPHLLNFDAIYTTKFNSNHVLDSFNKVSIETYGSPIFVECE